MAGYCDNKKDLNIKVYNRTLNKAEKWTLNIKAILQVTCRGSRRV